MSVSGPTVSPAPADPLAGLDDVLWRQRRMLENLVYRLSTQQLLIAAGAARWARHSTDEVDTAIAEIRACELDRALDAEFAAGHLGLAPDATLGAIAAASPEPWPAILQDHLADLAAMLDEACALLATNSVDAARRLAATFREPGATGA
jgi:hypothetical protein